MTVRDRLRQARRSTWARLTESTTQLSLVFLGTVVGTVLLQTAPNPPATAGQWVQVICGAMLALSALARIVVRALTSAHARRERPTRDRARRWPWVLVSLLVVGLVGGLAGPPMWQVVRGLSWGIVGCPVAAQLRLAAEPETIMTAREVATAYEHDPAAKAYGCPTVQVFVFEAPAAAVAQRLDSTDGWSDTSGALVRLGPRPDMWLASTGHEVAAVRARVLPGHPDPVVGQFPVARSPLVLTAPADTPQPAAGWPEVFRRLVDTGAAVDRPDPATGELGLLATTLLYGGEPQRPTGRADRPPLPPHDVEQYLTRSPGAQQRPPGDAALLCSRRAAAAAGAPDPPPVAVITSEQEVARFNDGMPLGGSCGRGPRPDARHRLQALYPLDTADQDLQLVALGWGDDDQQRAAAAFGAWLQGEAGRDALVGTGLRPAVSTGSTPFADPLTTEFGVDPVGSPSSEPLAPDRWVALPAPQHPRHLLFLFDTSQATALPGPDRTRGQAAAAAVRTALLRLDPGDEFGVWLVPGTGPGHSEPVPLGPNTPDRRIDAAQALAPDRLSAQRPLGQAVRDGVGALSTREPSDERALVVLTTGEDTGGAVPAGPAAAAAGGVRVVVVTLDGIRCGDTGLPALDEQNGDECVDTDDATVREKVPELVDGLRSGGR